MNRTTDTAAHRTPPPGKHELAFMIWLCVFPTLTAINLAFAGWLGPMPPVLRTFVLATIAVPIVIYGLMPRLQRLRARLLRSAPETLRPTEACNALEQLDRIPSRSATRPGAAASGSSDEQEH